MIVVLLVILSAVGLAAIGLVFSKVKELHDWGHEWGHSFFLVFRGSK